MMHTGLTVVAPPLKLSPMAKTTTPSFKAGDVSSSLSALLTDVLTSWAWCVGPGRRSGASGAEHVSQITSGVLHHASGCAAVPCTQHAVTSLSTRSSIYRNRERMNLTWHLFDSLNRHFTPWRDTTNPCGFSLEYLSMYSVLHHINQSSTSSWSWLCCRKVMI